MDFFTHIVFSYFLNIGLGNKQFIFGIGIGILPDMDLLWSPLGKKYYWAKHRALTHSISFIFLLSFTCSIIASVFYGLVFWEILPYAIITGLAHIAVDLVTTSGIPILIPFSYKEYKFEIDKAVNPYIMAVSFFSILFLNYLGHIDYSYSKFKIYVAIITLGFICYYIIKLVTKLWLVRKHSSSEKKFGVLPSSGFFNWYIVRKLTPGDKHIVEYKKINLLHNRPVEYKAFSFSPDNNLKPPLDEIEKVKSYTYNLKEVQNYIKKFKYPLADVARSGQGGKKWVIFWYPLELQMLNRTSALRIDLSFDGTYTSRRIFLKKILW